MGKREIAHNEQFLLFLRYFLLNQIIVSPFVHIFYTISLFAAELEGPKIGISGKRLRQFSTLFQLYHGSQWTYPCFPGVLFTSNLHNILSKPVAAFPHNHYQNNGQWWDRNESCCNAYHQSSERILAKRRIEPAVSCSQVLYASSWAMKLCKNILQKLG